MLRGIKAPAQADQRDGRARALTANSKAVLFLVAQMCLSCLTCVLALKRTERSKKRSWGRIFVGNPKPTPKLMNFLYVKAPLLRGFAGSRAIFPKQVVVPRYRGYSLICRAPVAEISIYINYLFNLVLLKQQNRIYNLPKKRFT